MHSTAQQAKLNERQDVETLEKAGEVKDRLSPAEGNLYSTDIITWGAFQKKDRFPTYFDKKCGQTVVVDPRDQPSSFLAPLGVYFGGGEN